MTAVGHADIDAAAVVAAAWWSQSLRPALTPVGLRAEVEERLTRAIRLALDIDGIAVLTSDYEPCQVLADALEASELELALAPPFFPLKTTMIIGPGDVKVTDGYRPGRRSSWKRLLGKPLWTVESWPHGERAAEFSARVSAALRSTPTGPPPRVHELPTGYVYTGRDEEEARRVFAETLRQVRQAGLHPVTNEDASVALCNAEAFAILQGADAPSLAKAVLPCHILLLQVDGYDAPEKGAEA